VVGMRSNEVMQDAPLNWRRASNCQTGECVEVARHGDVIVMRSSGHPDAGYVYFDPKQFSSFLAEVKTFGTCQYPVPELKLAK
jgi:Domain of unknown function (DUF397)